VAERPAKHDARISVNYVKKIERSCGIKNFSQSRNHIQNLYQISVFSEIQQKNMLDLSDLFKNTEIQQKNVVKFTRISEKYEKIRKIRIKRGAQIH
jgi:hypothetical protein